MRQLKVIARWRQQKGSQRRCLEGCVGVSVLDGSCAAVVYWIWWKLRENDGLAILRVALVLFFIFLLAHLMQPSDSLMLSVNIWLLRLKVNIRNCGSGTERQVRRKQGAMAFCSQKSVSVDSEGQEERQRRGRVGNVELS